MRSLRFSLGPFPVTVQPSFFFIALIVALGGAGVQTTVIVTVSAFVSVLVHELAHAVAFRAFGRASSITLHAMGGVTVAPGPALPPAREIVTSLAGPLTGVAIGVPLLMMDNGLLRFVGAINLTWAVFNLLPILPLDGGQAMRAVIERIRPGRATVLAHIVSILAAAIVAVVAFRLDYTIAAALTAYFGVMNASDLAAARAMRADAPAVGRALTLLSAGHADEALVVCEGLLANRSLRAGPRAAALEITAWAKVCLGRTDDARATIESFAPGHTASEPLLGALDLLDGSRVRGVERIATGLQNDDRLVPASLGAIIARTGATDDLLERVANISDPDARRHVQGRLQVMLHIAGRYPESAALGLALLTDGQNAIAAYNLACSLARLDDAAGALDALQRAVDAGFDDADGLRADPDLSALHADPRFDGIYAIAVRNRADRA